MRLWLVLYVGQAIGGIWGPLPYSEAECNYRAEEQNLKLQLLRKSPDKVAKLREEGFDPDTLPQWRFECTKSAIRPFIPTA